VGLEAFLRSIDADEDEVRARACEGLIAVGASDEVLAAMWTALGRGGPERDSAARVLRFLPDARSIAPLAQALASEADADLREALATAHNTCILRSGKTDLAALEARLAARAPATGPGLALKWSDGKPLSDGAQRWLRAHLEAEDGGADRLHGEPELAAVCLDLEPGSAAAASAALWAAHPHDSEHKWVLYQQAYLGDDAQQDALGAQLGEWVHTHSPALAGHGLAVLGRRPTPSAVRWLDHWARKGTPRLRAEAQALLDGHLRARGLERDAWVEACMPRLGFDAAGAQPLGEGKQKVKAQLLPGGTLTLLDGKGRPLDRPPTGLELPFQALAGRVQPIVAELKERLLAAMLTERTWDPQAFRALLVEPPLMRAAAASLWFAHVLKADVRSGWGALFRVDASGNLVELDGQGFSLGKGRVGIPHPAALTEAQRTQASKSLDLARTVAPPFPQLHRPIVAEPRHAMAPLVAHAKLRTRQLRQNLETLGYRRGEPQEGGMITSASRLIGWRWSIVVEHDGYSAADGRNPLGETCAVKRVRIRREFVGDEEVPPPLWCEAWSDVVALVQG
jgi:hypothetical protein